MNRPLGAGRDNLLERGPHFGLLWRAFEMAREGRGVTVVVSGEAGVGKSSLVRAFVADFGCHATVFAGGCDDLFAPRVLGPIRDAFAADAHLTAVLDQGSEAIFAGVLTALRAAAPSILVVDDLHWADDRTLDVLCYLARRISDQPVLLIMTLRPEGKTHPAVMRLLGSLAGHPVQRIELQPLSVDAVRQLVGRGPRATNIHQLTGGNPFFVTEILAAPADDDVPASICEAVMARVHAADEVCRRGVEQLSVIPFAVGFDLLADLLLDATATLVEAESRGLLVVSEQTVRFRHELARRAVEASLPRWTRHQLHRNVLDVLVRKPQPDVARVAHHAQAAGDVAAICDYAPAAGREAAAAGAHHEALAHFTVALRFADRFANADRARLLEEHAWELHNAGRFQEALDQSEIAVKLFRELGDRDGLGHALTRLSRHRFMVGHSSDALQAAQEAVLVLEERKPVGDAVDARTYVGVVLALTRDPSTKPGTGVSAEECADWVLDRAHHIATQRGRNDLVALCLNYLSLARRGISDDERISLLRQSLALALRTGCQEESARAYTNMAELLYRMDRFAALEEIVEEGWAYTVERGFWSHAYNLQVHRALRWIRVGRWAEGTDELAGLVDDPADVGMLIGYSRPWLTRLQVRRGDMVPLTTLMAQWRSAMAQNMLLPMAFSGAALAEWAWWNDRPDVATALARQWLEHATRPTAGPAWGEILCYAHRAGADVSSLLAAQPCPAPWRLTLAGDWAAAAEAWACLGDPYEEGLALVGSDDPSVLLRAKAQFDRLGAGPAAVAVTSRLAALGHEKSRPRRTTWQHAAGLTQRQDEIARLVAQGLTNSEIAGRLFLSVRTVDAHVSTVLTKLGLSSRRAIGPVVGSWHR